MAKTPLAIAEAGLDDARIMFVNDAFAELLDSDSASWVGRPLSALGAPATGRFARGSTFRFDIARASGQSFPAALSVAPVVGPDGDPFCLLCSLVDARGEGADAAIARDAALLADVAAAAGELMAEAESAARFSSAHGGHADAAGLALDAVTHQTNEGRAA